MTPMPTAAEAIRSTHYLGHFPRARTDSWVMVGQDGGQSIDLGGQVLFLFSDTLLAPLRSTHRTTHRQAPIALPAAERGIFLGNSAALARGGDLRQALIELRYYIDDEGFPREILTATHEEREQGLRFWPEHGISIAGKVYLYYLGIQTVDRSSIWGFRNLGVGLAVLDPESGSCSRVRRNGNWCLWPSVSDDFHFGVQVLRAEGCLYVFGSLRDGLTSHAIVARTSPERITDPSAYEYFDPVRSEWRDELETTSGLGESGSEYSISYNPYLGKYLMIYVDSYRKTLMLRSAAGPIGPYAAPRGIVRVPHEPWSELVYLGFEHSTFQTDNGARVYISYCESCFTPNTLVELRFK